MIAVATAAVGIISAIVFWYPASRPGSHDLNSNENETLQQHEAGGTNIDNGYEQLNISIKDVELAADIAATEEQQSKGLSVKEFLRADQAMLFPFKTESEHDFWMKGMKFPIDIIWLDSNKKVVHIEPSLDPCNPGSPCPIYRPGVNSLYVLETASGFAQENNVTLGTRVEFSLPES